MMPNNLTDLVTQCFGRNGAKMGAAATHLALILDNRHAQAAFYCSHGRRFAGGAGSDNYQVPASCNLQWLHAQALPLTDEFQ